MLRSFGQLSKFPNEAFYAKRWNFETLFGILTSRGFRFEETHLIEADRINKLLALLTLATVWAFKVGEGLHQQEPLKVKTHGRLAKSIFRYGLDYLPSIVFDIQLKIFGNARFHCSPGLALP